MEAVIIDSVYSQGCLVGQDGGCNHGQCVFPVFAWLGRMEAVIMDSVYSLGWADLRL